MAFKPNAVQQINMEDALLNLPPRVKKFVEKSWSAGFSEIIFPQINEKRFAVLYSDNPATRPNTPVNAIIGALIIKELFSLTDEDLLESILCDVRFQVALRTTSFKEQPFSDRTFSRFRERLYYHELNTGEDLLKEEMVDLAEAFRKYLNIEPTLKRMDSLMVASGSKKMSRLEILYTCVANLVKQLHKNGETTLVQPLQTYLKEEHRNQIIYHQRHEDLDQRLNAVIQDAKHLMDLMPVISQQTEAYHHLVRVMEEQTHTDDTGTTIAKPKKDISTQSMQNPSDPDATFRWKSGQNHKGYVAHVVETTGKEGSMITAYEYQPNTHSDNEFCRKTIEEMGPQKEKTTLVADGAYASTENTLMAEANNIDLVTTSLFGKAPNEVQAHFKLDTENHKVLKCPAGKKPYKTCYSQQTGIYRASFTLSACQDCPLRNQCGMKPQKKSNYVMITEKTVQRAKYLQKYSLPKYQELARIRNGVEGIPSVLRRKHHVDQMPVRGYLRSKMWFGFKITAINVKRVLKKVRQDRFLPDILTNIQDIWETMFSTQHFVRLWA
jgi:hypothetical protein